MDGANYLMIVEDDPLYARTLEDIFAKTYHYRVAVLLDGADAVTEVHKGMPKLVLADVIMPGIDGFKLCEVLKHQFTNQIHVVLMTGGKILDTDIELAARYGADSIISKQDTSVIVSKVREIMEA